MSGYILCQVKRAKLPYYIENISTNIYSIEELCFYFYHNIYPKSHKTKRRNEKMFTNDYFTKAMGYVIDGESRGSKESAMKYLTGSGFMERQEAESYLAHLFRVWRNLSAANAR